MRKISVVFVVAVVSVLAAVVEAKVLRSMMWVGQGGRAVTVSAAGFSDQLAPESLAATFGERLATGIQAASVVPLPAEMLGTSVTIRDRSGRVLSCPLLFVSPNQINHLIPAETLTGEATITVRSGTGALSTSQVMIREIAPMIFTANNTGKGVPAANAVRTLRTGEQLVEAVAVDGPGRQRLPRPLDLGPEGEKVTLVLYLTGLRRLPSTDGNEVNGAAERVDVIIGGVKTKPHYAGRQASFVGLDQINVDLPRALLDPVVAGSKLVSIVVKATGYADADSNTVEISLAPTSTDLPLEIDGFSGALPALAMTELRIRGAGLTPEVDRNHINFGEGTADTRAGEVVNASVNELQVVVPFGAISGPISVNSGGRRWTSPASVAVQTSFSGSIKDSLGQPLPQPLNTGNSDATRICSPNCNAGNPATALHPDGWFVLGSIQPSARRVFVIEPGNQTSPLQFNPTAISSAIGADRDNALPHDVYLQAVYGPSGIVGGFDDGPSFLSASAPDLDLTIDGFRFVLPASAEAHFPGGESSGVVTLTPIKHSLTPAPLPANYFSAAIVQLSPFGTKFTLGGKLTFPNQDGLKITDSPQLFKYDFQRGEFVDTGIRGKVSTDTGRIETPDGAVTETGIYFFGVAHPTTTIAGRVVDSDGVTGVHGAIIYARGRQTSTDSNGGFVLTRVPVGDFNDTLPILEQPSSEIEKSHIRLQASYLRSNGRVDQVRLTVTSPLRDSISEIGAIVLPDRASNRPPVLGVAGQLTVYAGELLDEAFLAYDLDEGQSIKQVKVTGADFVWVSRLDDHFKLTLSPAARNVGTHLITISAADDAGAVTKTTITVSVLRPKVNAEPAIIKIMPDMIPSGTSDITLTVNGAGFGPESVIRLNGKAIITTLVSPNELRGVITADQLRTPGIYAVNVYTPGPGGGSTRTLDFTVLYPVPNLTGVHPERLLAGVANQIIELQGIGFTAQTLVELTDGVMTEVVRPALIADDKLLLDLPRDLIAEEAAQKIMVTLLNPSPGGGRSISRVVDILPPPVIDAAFIGEHCTSGKRNRMKFTVSGSNFERDSTLSISARAGLNFVIRSVQYINSKTLIVTGDYETGIAGHEELTVTVSTPALGLAAHGSATFNFNPGPLSPCDDDD